MELVGRHDAIGAGRAALASATGAAVAIVGQHGSGVSEVIDALAEQALNDFDRPTLRGSGRFDEAEIPLALLRELAAHDASGSLASTLVSADRAALADAVLDWACAHANATAIVIDDFQLADETSRITLLHLARRVELSTTVVIIGTHDGDDVFDLSVVELMPMSLDELLRVLTDRAGVSDSGVARQIAALADGSPLVAIEVAKALDEPQRRGTEPLPSFAITATPIRHAFEHAIAALPAETRAALCVAAAEPTGELRTIAAALGVLDSSLERLEPAEAAGVITIDDGAVHFDHPIRRSVAYRQLAPASRRATHRALASALAAPRDAERRAAHLAAGVIEPDEQLAADLELVAEAAERRRDHLEARRWWLAAARLSPRAADAERRTARGERDATDDDPLAGLTKAERRVAAVVGAGATNKKAASTLYVSVKTVDAHLQSIYRKLAIGSRAELAVLVTQADLAGAAAAG